MSRSADLVLANRSRAAAFLCYHSISADGPVPLSVRPETFERHLFALRKWGYAAGDHRALIELASGARRRRPLAFLTFDDGFHDTCTDALPLLQAYGFKALIFVLPPLVDGGERFGWPELGDAPARYPAVFRSLDWRAVEILAAAGAEFGSHTCRHRDLTELDGEELREELADSRARLKQRLGRCDSIAYPFGTASPGVAAAARAVGYKFGFTLPYGAVGVGWQRGVSRLTIPRIPIAERDDRRRFRAKLSPMGRRLLLSPVKAGVRAVERRSAASGVVAPGRRGLPPDDIGGRRVR